MTAARQTWGIFGGSFNPPHIAHVLACHFALAAWDIDKVLVVPAFRHPFGKTMEPFEHRVRMCELALKHLGSYVAISRIEEQLGGISYTVETLRALREQLPDVDLRLIIGGDILEEASKWRSFEEVKKIAPVLVIPRVRDGEVLGANGSACLLPDISSTQLRANLHSGKDVGLSIPKNVLQYIWQQALYVSGPTG